MKLILRVKKRENENHKQIINLITRLSKGEKVNLSRTSIEVIDPVSDSGSVGSQNEMKSSVGSTNILESVGKEEPIMTGQEIEGNAK